jgi:ABC-type multidrug transport system fused ATPase/permease subunit
MTIIVISHRPSTLAFCDDMVVLHRGRVVETGPFSAAFSHSVIEAGAAGNTGRE